MFCRGTGAHTDQDGKRIRRAPLSSRPSWVPGNTPVPVGYRAIKLVFRAPNARMRVIRPCSLSLPRTQRRCSRARPRAFALALALSCTCHTHVTHPHVHLRRVGQKPLRRSIGAGRSRLVCSPDRLLFRLGDCRMPGWRTSTRGDHSRMRCQKHKWVFTERVGSRLLQPVVHCPQGPSRVGVVRRRLVTTAPNSWLSGYG